MLGALAVDDTASSMPMLLPRAAGDLESFMNNDTISLGDQLGQVTTAEMYIRSIYIGYTRVSRTLCQTQAS